MAGSNPLELRGHHLSLFATYYFRYKDGTLDEGNSNISRKYGPQMKKRIDLLFNSLILRPNSKVRIVKGLDTLCQKCPIYNSLECCEAMDAEDLCTVQEYDFETGREYTFQDMINRFEEYKRSTGFDSPQAKFLELLPLFEEPKRDDCEISDEEIDRFINGREK